MSAVEEQWLVLIVIMLQIEECVVCSESRASVLFQPCMHMVACEGRCGTVSSMST